MKITAGLGSVDDYPMYVEAGADECFCGYVPFAWAEKYGVLNPLNRREVRAYNVQIGSYEELKILGNMRKYYQVPVAITFNSLSYTPEQYPVRALKNIGFVNFIFKGIRNPPVSNQVLVDFLNSV